MGGNLPDAAQCLHGNLLVRDLEEPVRVDERHDARVRACDGHVATREGRQERDAKADEAVRRGGAGGGRDNVDGDVFDVGPVGGEFCQLSDGGVAELLAVGLGDLFEAEEIAADAGERACLVGGVVCDGFR